jgi:hypothetical protein
MDKVILGFHQIRVGHEWHGVVAHCRNGIRGRPCHQVTSGVFQMSMQVAGILNVVMFVVIAVLSYLPPSQPPSAPYTIEIVATSK